MQMNEAIEVTKPKIFNGYHTLRHKASNDHWTFKIMTAGPMSRFKGQRIISYLAGPDNRWDYVGIGTIVDEGIKPWKKWIGSSPLRMAEVLWKVAVLGELKDKYDWLLSGHCAKCNKLLTVPESIESGYGPICDGRNSDSTETKELKNKLRAAKELLRRMKDETTANPRGS